MSTAGGVQGTMSIDIVSDVVCPWCIVGYLQLRKALGLLSVPLEAQLRWHPFELNPDMPPEGEDVSEHIARKYGSTRAQSDVIRARLAELGEGLGFRFDYHDGMRIVNTFQAHQLLAWAEERGRQTELKLALFEAYFSRREDVSSAGLLAEIAVRAGLPGAEAAAVLADGRYAATVRAAQRQWLEREVHAVPLFVFDGRFAVPGAQDAATFVRVLEKLRTLAPGPTRPS